jgi:RNA polymerase I-specific transcription initiation factor RRN6
MRTLHSFAQAELDVGDVEACSSALARLESFQNVRADGSPEPASGDVENTHRLALAPVDIPSSLGLEDLRLDTGLSSVYDCTLATWVTPLSENIPGRIRLAKAKLCGLVSAQLVLASQSLRIEEPPEMQPAEEDTQTQTQSQDPHSQTLQLPSHQFGINRGFTFSQLASSQPFPSSALPTPSQTNTPSQTPSITTASTHTTLFSAPEPHRLSKFTTFTKPPPPALPRSLANILSHWTPGENLETYDWMSTARVLAQQDEDANEEMTETERRRAQRRAERHLKRQRKEAAASQAREVASSQAPAIFSQPPRGVESQPLSGMPPASSQFTAVGGTGVTSQVEAGRFGGRPGPSAAAAAGVAGKKRRRQGF